MGGKIWATNFRVNVERCDKGRHGRNAMSPLQGVREC